MSEPKPTIAGLVAFLERRINSSKDSLSRLEPSCPSVARMHRRIIEESLASPDAVADYKGHLQDSQPLPPKNHA